MFFSSPRVTFTTNMGNLGSKSVTVPWINGIATAILRADEGHGIATITANDYQTVQTFVKILGAEKSKSQVNAQTVPMHNTGIPIAGIILAFLMVLGGFIGTRKKQ